MWQNDKSETCCHYPSSSHRVHGLTFNVESKEAKRKEQEVHRENTKKTNLQHVRRMWLKEEPV